MTTLSRLPRPAPLVAVGLGALATLPWCLLDLGMVRPLPPVAAWAGAVFLAVAVGGAIGLGTAPVRSRPLLTALLLVPPPILGAATLASALGRAVELYPVAGLATELFGVLFASTLVTALSWKLSRGAAARHRQWRMLLSASAGIAAACVAVLLPPVARTAVAIGAPLVAGCLSLYALANVASVRRVNPGIPWMLACLLSAWMLHQLEPFYAGLRTIVAMSLVNLSLLAIRFSLSPRVAPEPKAGGATIALVAVLAATVGADRILRVPGSVPGLQATGLAAALVRDVREVFDFDGDGHGPLFGQHDCAPSDRAISPSAHETPGNGVDENCSGGDPGAEVAQAWVRQHLWVHQAPPAWRGDVVVVLIDALRYDEAQSATLPTFRAIERRAITFDRAYATSTLTMQSLAGILAARLGTSLRYDWPKPQMGYVTHVPWTLFSKLAELGFDTGIADATWDHLYSADTFGRGARIRELGDFEEPPDRTVDAALRVWARMDAARRRLLYVHFTYTHGSYATREGYRARIAETDRALGRLWRDLGNDNLWIMLADHGEAFGEHGHESHSHSIHEETAHVPLWVSIPGQESHRVGVVTTLLSITPTLVAMVSPQTPTGLGPYLCLGGGTCQDIEAPIALEKRSLHLHGLRTRDHHLIRDVPGEWVSTYDVRTDPEQRLPSMASEALVRQLGGWEECAMAAPVWP